jgi:hypothetical protein
MPLKDLIYVQTLSGFSKKFRSDLIIFFQKLTEDLQVQIQEDVFLFSKKNKGKVIKGKYAEFHHAMFLMAIYQVWKLETPYARKATLTDKEMKQAHSIRLSMVKSKPNKPSKKRAEVIKNYIGLIKGLRKDGLSWRNISSYIAKYKKRKFSHTYLKEIYSEIEKE